MRLSYKKEYDRQWVEIVKIHLKTGEHFALRRCHGRCIVLSCNSVVNLIKTFESIGTVTDEKIKHYKDWIKYIVLFLHVIFVPGYLLLPILKW